jgi:hypothetical protein
MQPYFQGPPLFFSVINKIFFIYISISEKIYFLLFTSLKHHSLDVNIDADYDSKVIFI